MQVHEPGNFGNAAFAPAARRHPVIAENTSRRGKAKRAALLDGPLHHMSKSRDQIVGFQADGISRYPAPSFSTCPIEGKVKWKPTTVAFSAAAMS
jgi:hypothetical protein